MGDFTLPPIVTKQSIGTPTGDDGGKLEIVLAGDAHKSEITQHPPQVSKARRRLARATLSVLNQVIMDKTTVDDDDDEKGNADHEKDLTKQLETADNPANETISRTNSIDIDAVEAKARRQSQIKLPPLRQTSVQSQDTKRKKTEKKRKLSLASVVNMAQFRKIYMSRLIDQAAEKPPSPLPENPQPRVLEALPERPRFIATLSPEAQYAALKAYEDVLLDKLQHSYPEQRNNLFRVRTPTLKRVSFPLEPNTQYARTIENEDDLTSSQLTISNYSITSKTHHQGANSRVKRRLTIRFQAGMDILDRLKSSQGMMVTSPRIVREETAEPVASYNNWIQNWANEFLLNDK